jgi:hypothetical protein
MIAIRIDMINEADADQLLKFKSNPAAWYDNNLKA